MKIISRADSTEVWVNGEKVNAGYDYTTQQGQIALQAEGVQVAFKNLRLTPLRIP